jgi:diguanylate cyclase (GGDEF)-like protein
MSMYRQLWLALVISTLLAMAGSLLASTLSARAYLQEQLRMKNTDNAAALALSLSQQNADLVEVEVAVSAMFDSGHYESIKVVDPFGKVVVERLSQSGEYDAPKWFVGIVPVAAPAGEAMITDGWKQVGKVALVSHSRFAYRELWKSTVNMMIALTIAGLIGAYLGTLILRRLKRPLDSVIEQAKAISERRFMTKPEPDVPELRQLSRAMNFAVERIKAMFEEEASRLEAVRRETNCDPLTGLANRSHFMARLHAAADSEEVAEHSLVLIRVANLAEINRKLGRANTDNLLKTIAGLIEKRAQGLRDGLAARLNGADFGLLLSHADPRAVAEDLLKALVSEEADIAGDKPVAFIGIGRFRTGTDLGSLLTQVDTALASAEADGVSAVRELTPLDIAAAPRSAEQMAQLIRHALEQRWVRLVSFPVADFAGATIHRECPLRLMFDADGEWLPAGQFMPVAERLGLTSSLDLTAVALGLEELAAQPALPGLAVNLSARSLEDENFRRRVRELVISHASARRLWLEVSENGALAHLDAFRAFCKELGSSGCRLGLEHFGRQFSQIGRLHDLGLHYLKVDASFIRGITGNEGNQAFLKGLTNIAHNIGLQVFAEGVTSADDMPCLESLGFDGATGPAVKSAQDTA